MSGNDRFTAALALVLAEETGYAQPEGGPYVRLLVTHESNARRRKRGEAPLTVGRYVLDDGSGKLRHGDGTLIDLPRRPDGMAFDDHPRDPGGRTGMGILQREYDAWRRARGFEARDVWRIADDELRDIYRRQYWDACKCDRLEPGVAEMTFNTAVNCGVGTAARQLQMTAGVKADGIIGEVTIAAAVAMPAADVVARLAVRQEARYRSLAGFRDFGRNWLDRNARMKAWCTARAADVALCHESVTDEIADIGACEARTARAHDDVPASIADSTTASAAAFIGHSSKLPPFLPVLQKAHEFTAAGKSLLSLEFVLAVASSPDVWVMLALSGGMIAAARYIIGERVKRLVHMGV